MIGYQTSRSGKKICSPEEHWRRQRRKRQLAKLTMAERCSVEHICHHDNLIREFHAYRPGSAPGPDGIRKSDLTGSEAAAYARVLSERLLSGNYRPHPTRSADIPKRGTNETRTLRIRDLWDRVIGKAVSEAIQPLVEANYLDMSHGFRPGRSGQTMLADLKASMEVDGLWILATADVRKAFDSVYITDVLDAHQRLFEQQRDEIGDFDAPDGLLDLIERILRGHDPNREVGIDQGCPYSPTALMVLLHMNHDLPLTRELTKPFWTRHPVTPLRYADDLVYATRSVNEGHRVLRHARKLLRIPHLELKDGAGMHRLSAGVVTQLLGFNIWRTGRGKMGVGLANDAMDLLREHLEQAHREPDPIATARKVLQGWANSMGPAFRSGRNRLSKLYRTVAELGFREAVVPGELEQRWYSSWTRWCETCMAARRSRESLGLGSQGREDMTAGSI